MAALSGQATAVVLLSSVSGHVTTTNGDAVEGCTVVLSNSGGTVGSATTDPSGHYAINAPTGAYYMDAIKDDLIEDYSGVPVSIGAQPTIKDITVVPLFSKVKITQAKDTIVADGQDFTALTAHITDAWDKVVPGCTVRMETVETGMGTLSSSPAKATSSLITLTPDPGANYIGYYGWVPASGKKGQATVRLTIGQSYYSGTYDFDIDVEAASTPSPSAATPTPSAITPVPSAALPTAAAGVDNIAPVTTASFDGSQANTPGVYSSNVTVTLTATDEGGSGVARTQYRFGTMPWTTYDGPFTVKKNGDTTIYFRSADNSGNTESTKTATVNITRPVNVSRSQANATATETATDMPSATPATTATASPSKGPCVIFVVLPLFAIGIMAYAGRKKGGT